MATDDDRLAHGLAAEAGHRLVALRAQGGEPENLRKAGDRMSHEFLTAELARLRPGDVVLSEEGADNPARLTADRVWIVDPLDGTREFGDAGRTDWAVHVALWERAPGEQGALTASAVALPALDEVLSTASPPPAPPSARPARQLRIVVSRTRPAPFLPRLAEILGADIVPLGSAGAKVAAVLKGDVDAYVHAGGQYEWDSAAPVAVARSCGFHASRIDGSGLSYNRADLLMPDILVCPPVLAGPLLDAIRSAQADGRH
ncbi:MAG TPA: 3'(2'),5'-bisphosphate nucleotidase CysQ [Streptosporangiaceae bacterium]|jgi:3'(2'), 5'-bisphosphate nucleotidase|nr:3'(2'),5'-bisphosphate nucleotidase CysQ [Streptosporangiaceae bacterium]